MEQKVTGSEHFQSRPHENQGRLVESRGAKEPSRRAGTGGQLNPQYKRAF